MATDQELLEEVQTIIRQVLRARRVTVNGETWETQDLDALYRRESMLQRRVNAQAGGGLCTNAVRLSRE